MTDTTNLYCLILVWMPLTSIKGQRVLRKLEPVQSFVKGLEVARFAIIDCEGDYCIDVLKVWWIWIVLTFALLVNKICSWSGWTWHVDMLVWWIASLLCWAWMLYKRDILHLRNLSKNLKYQVLQRLLWMDCLCFRCVTITCLSFNHDATFLCSSSNTETVHVFKLEQPKEK